MQRELYNSNRIQEGFQEHPSERLNQLNPSNTLAALEGISFRYDSKEDLVLEDFSLSIGEGEIFCLLGESGCGKTTCLQLLGGFLFPEKGKIL
ncbi:ATP-binding cassette domain-containing protein, partial [Oribacterium sinus]|uniref:ATP-binding cassette domain-containing protein n=1 Tax=Oribacterium sinus TaxID=237576 RepID=UPI0026F1FA7E